MVLGWLALTLTASAEVPMSGSFTATTACPAYQSINRQSNPGQAMTQSGQSYELIAANATPPTHYLLLIPGASPERRWVSVECGTAPVAANAIAPKPTPTRYRGTQYVLAVNWQPAFCETSSRKPECRRQTADSFEATNFTLHGLWPQPRDREYCNVPQQQRWDSQDGAWDDLPPIALPSGLRRDLDIVMPGSISRLDRHEWTKHGTCYGTDQQGYFTDALDLMGALNASPVAQLFAGNIGKRVTLAQVRDAFDEGFGAGAGERVQMDCSNDGNRQIITELTIALTGEITGPDDLAQLIASAEPMAGGCKSGIVDAVGLR